VGLWDGGGAGRSCWLSAIRTLLVGGAALLFGAITGPVSRAQAAGLYGPSPDIYSTNDFGGIGLINTRTARFAPDGQLEAGISLVNPFRRYYITWQIFPWLEATFRYTDFTNNPFIGDTGRRDFDQGRFFKDFFTFKQGNTFLDRGADLKLKIRDESRLWPALALGLQDSLGTGKFSGEYFVASKRFGDFDVTLGLGWGYFATRATFKNPFRLLGSRFKSRGGGKGGIPLFSNFFTGRSAAVFGGVEYFSPIEGLTVKVEYNSADPAREPRRSVPSSGPIPFNLAVNYRASEWFEFGMGFERGNSFMLRAAFRYNLNKPGLPKIEQPPPELKPRAQARNGLPDKARQDPEGGPTTDPTPAFKELGYQLENLDLPGGRAVLVRAQGLGQDARLTKVEFLRTLFALVPPDVNQIEIQVENDGRDQGFVLQRGTVRKWAMTDRAFSRYRDQGATVDRVELLSTTLTLAFMQSPAAQFRDPEAIAALAQATVTFAPYEVRTLSLEGLGSEAVSFVRDRLAEAVVRDRIVAFLEENGFGINQLLIKGVRATLRLEVPYWAARDDYRELGEYVLSMSSDLIASLTVVGTRKGVEVAQYTTRRHEAGREPTVAEDRGGEPLSNEEIARRIFVDLGRYGFYASAIHITDFRATIYVQGVRFRETARNLGWISRVAANHLPPDVEGITVVTIIGGMEVSRISIIRKDIENAVAHRGSPEEILAHAEFKKPQPGLRIPDDAIRGASAFPLFRWNIRPTLQQHIGDPDQGAYLADVNAMLALRFDLAPGLAIRAAWEQFLFGNLNKIRSDSDSVLPRVRSDIRKYLQESRSALVRLEADYLFSPLPDIYARLSAGLFERMFGGFGGEVLYRPYGKRWAIGADLNWVKQRDFNQRLDFRAYSVVTGHVTLNYELPYYNLLATLDVGRYLAKDVGATFTISREFRSGIRVGAWATKTNVSAAEFGEGSFDKGFYISFPLQVFMTQSSRDSAVFAFRPLTRDGGQKLIIGPKLYDITREGAPYVIIDDWNTILD